MNQTAIPFVFMRGGSSRGPYFRREDLPKDADSLAKVLISVVGSGHPLNIDGLGGGIAVTTKTAMLSKSKDDWADIDYFFAQVSVKDQTVDTRPTCGNILSGVGQAAIELGLIAPKDGKASIKILATNTGARAIAEFEVKDGRPVYTGSEVIDGIPGKHAVVMLKFMDVVGSNTGAFLPTGNLIDTINGVEVTCMDVGMPMVLARGADFGINCTETREALDANQHLFDAIEPIRLQAAEIMGMGDCSNSVTPKFGLIAPAHAKGDLAARYFMPWQAHPAMAVTGAQCMAACALAPNTIADGMIDKSNKSPSKVAMEHPSGVIEIVTEYNLTDGVFEHISSGVHRSARMIAKGDVFVPETVWNGEK